MQTDLLQAALVLALAGSLPFDLGLATLAVVLWQPGDEKLINITVRLAHVLVVIKDGIEVVQALRGKQADGGNHVGNRTCGEGAAGVAYQDDGIAVNIIGADEVVYLADILRLLVVKLKLSPCAKGLPGRVQPQRHPRRCGRTRWRCQHRENS